LFASAEEIDFFQSSETPIIKDEIVDDVHGDARINIIGAIRIRGCVGISIVGDYLGDDGRR